MEMLLSHPGPPPGRRCCRHDDALLTWTLVNQVERFQFDCLKCGARAVRPGYAGSPPAGWSRYAGRKRCREIFGEDPGSAIERPSEEVMFEIDRAREAAHQAEWWEWYERYLQSIDWMLKRTDILERDNFRCQHCGAEATQVHHLTYARVGYENLEDLVAVCGPCHEWLHRKRVS